MYQKQNKCKLKLIKIYKIQKNNYHMLMKRKCIEFKKRVNFTLKQIIYKKKTISYNKFKLKRKIFIKNLKNYKKNKKNY